MKTDPNDGAFAAAAVNDSGRKVTQDGLSKRELFSAMAMQGMLSSPHTTVDWNASDVISGCVAAADALIKELNKEKQES